MPKTPTRSGVRLSYEMALIECGMSKADVDELLDDFDTVTTPKPLRRVTWADRVADASQFLFFIRKTTNCAVDLNHAYGVDAILRAAFPEYAPTIEGSAAFAGAAKGYALADKPEDSTR